MKWSIILPVKHLTPHNRVGLTKVSEYLKQTPDQTFELILVPNLPALDPDIGRSLLAEYPELQITDLPAQIGKGSAVKHGVQSARGDFVLMLDCDVPFDLDFMKAAREKLESGADFVTGNRRLYESHFLIPAELMKIAYRRHRLGMLYNLLVRLTFGVKTLDTQAGIKAMTQKFAREAFSTMTCPGFHFDIELFLVQMRRGYRWAEIPVTLRLDREKSTVRVIREGFSFFYWYLKILFQDKQSFYSSRVTTVTKPNRTLS
ncbi:MAG: glycosyltransferase [Proteobacteria bacterium]|nr:MAG: glycosyltransferase [Pseudomonadota bacterium]